MHIVVKALRFLVLVLSIAATVLVLGLMFLVFQDRRRLAPIRPHLSPVDTSTPHAEKAVLSPDGDLEWSREEINILRGQMENATIIALLEMLRDREGAPVNYRELMERTGRTMAQVRGDLSGFSRVARSIPGHDHWPIEAVKPTDGRSNKAYTAPKPYLDWWFEQ